MGWLGGAWTRLRRGVRGAVAERELDEEFRFHLEMETERNIRAGLPLAEARRQALIAFGGVERHKAAMRDGRRVGWLADVSQDLRFGMRMLARRPAFTAVAVLTLAVGIGATTSVFGLADAVLFRPVPGVRDADRLVQVRFRAPHLEDEETPLSYINLMDLRAAEMPAITHLFGWEGRRYQVAVPGEATALLEGAAVVGDYFGALDVRPAAGRLFGAAETELGASQPIVVLSERGRRRLFGEDARAVGRALSINGIPFTVVGIAGGGFRGATRGGDADFWIPYGLYDAVWHMEGYERRRGSGGPHDLAARLADGATPERAQAQLRAAMDRLITAYPAANEHHIDYRPTVFKQLGVLPWAANRTRTTMRLLAAGVALVLLIACANVANLLIFQGVRRQGESAVRQAMGASKGRLLRQHLAESGLLAAGGVVAGLLATAALARLFEGVRLPGLPPLESLPLDWRVAAFAAAAGAAAVLLAGLAPAMVVHRVELVRPLKDAAPTNTGRPRGLRAALTVLQLALSLTLLIGALLLVRTLRNLYQVALGFDPERVTMVYIDPEPQGYAQERVSRFRRELLAGAALLPDIEAAGAAYAGPLRAVTIADLRPAKAATDDWPVEAWADFISPTYFDAVGVRLLRGRTFSAEELAASRARASDVAIVNETLARRLFGTVDAVGRTVLHRGYRENEALRVIGVVADSRVRSLEGPREAALYRPLGEAYWNSITLVVRSARSPASVIRDVQALVGRLDPALPLYRAGSLADVVVREKTAEQRFLARLMGVLAALAVLLAGIGLYGVVAYSVAERTRELGIRVALGARGSGIVALVLRESLFLTACGLLPGLGAAWALAKVLENRLFGVGVLDPLVWVAAPAALLGLALIAAAAPARAAARIDPVRALKV